MCGYVRYIMAAWIGGLAATSLTGSDLWGALAAVVAAGATFAATRLFPGRLGSPACAIPDREPAQR